MTYSKYFHSIIHLRSIQIRYQLWYRLRKMWHKATSFTYPLFIEKEAESLKFKPWIEKPVSYNNGIYTFLNQTEPDQPFRGKKRGALWAYNFNYMDYLLQPNMELQAGKKLIEQFITDLPQNPKGLEPYPIALRGINWIKFLSSTIIAQEKEQQPKQTVPILQIDSSLFAQYKILLNNLEYHLLANHLLEDGFSLLFGGFYFSDQKVYNKGKEIIEQELNEQILNDGAHFELSPMYHQIILDRLLDCINLLQNNQRFDDQPELLKLMQNKVQKMLGWLNTITFSDGEIPLLNDSATDIAPSTIQLNEYARTLNIAHQAQNWKLSSSGYRKFTSPTYECIIDIGQIGPSYQPGHAHADTFNFVLNVKNMPLLVDSGISTYDPGKIRSKERGTAAHNTVTIQDKNSSEVWSSFRVARRAKVTIIKDEPNKVIAEHNGYRKSGTTHKREWNFSDNNINICDTLTGKIEEGKAHFWFSPELKPIQKGQEIKVNDVRFTFKNQKSVSIISSSISNGFNRFSKNYKVEITFKHHLKTIITID